MAGKSKSTFRDIFASLNSSDKYFGTIYEGMCKSKQFQKLSPKTQLIYVLCRVHAQTKKAKAALYKHAAEEGRKYDVNDFVFPDKQQDDYGEYDHSNFNKYMKKLVDAGFIDVKEENNYRHKTNVYSFSNRWKVED